MSLLHARILVVEDSEEMRELLVFLLESDGFVVVSCGDADQALAKARQERPDLILTDLMLGATSGLDLITRLRSDLAPPVPPIVVCSGFTSFESEALSRGAAAFIPKPFDPGTIRKTVTTILARRAMAAREHDEAAAQARALRTRAVEAAQAAVVRLAPRREDLRRRARWMTEFLVHYFGFGEAFCAMLDDETLRVRASSNERVWTPGLAVDLALCRDVMETGSALLVPDLSSLGAIVRSAGGVMLHFFACVPLLSGRVAVGTFCFVDSTPRHFGPDGYSVLEAFGRRGSQALSGCESETESLWSSSGLLTREGLCVLLAAELARLSSETLSLSVFAFNGRAPAWPEQERTAIARLGEGRFAALLARGSDDEARHGVLDFVSAFARSEGFVNGGLVNIEDCAAWSFQPSRILLAAEALLERALQDRPGTIERIVIRREPLAIEGATS